MTSSVTEISRQVQASANSAQVLTAARSLLDESSKLEADRFLSTVRAA
jgi:hypothetical protein